MQVLYKGFVLTPEQLKTQPKASIEQMDRQDKPSNPVSDQFQNRPKNKSPWFEYTELFYSKSRTDDIFAAQLSR